MISREAEIDNFAKINETEKQKKVPSIFIIWISVKTSYISDTVK